MNSFYEDIGKIAFIALLGVLLVGVFSMFVATETVPETIEPSDLIVEYNDMILSHGSHITTPILNGTLTVTYKDAKSIAVKIGAKPTKTYEGDHISITLPTEPESIYSVNVCAVDKDGMQTAWKTFVLTTKA